MTDSAAVEVLRGTAGGGEGAAWSLRPQRDAQGIFHAAPPDTTPGRTFGGRLVAQALVAAALPTDQKYRPHSVHAQFLRAADNARPTSYAVEALKDGSNFASRAVRVTQDGDLVAVALVSLGSDRPGLSRQRTMPDVPHPSELADGAASRAALRGRNPLLERLLWPREHPVQFRPVDFPDTNEDRPGRLTYWFRGTDELADATSPMGRAAMLAYVSDRFVMSSATLPHLSLLPDHEFILASLDHAIWIHRDHAPDSWLLYVLETTSAAGSRAFIRGEIFAENGDHVASVAQEGLLMTCPRATPNTNEEQTWR